MQTIIVEKPAQGNVKLRVNSNGALDMRFSVDAAVIERNGEDMVLTFGDGASITLQGFFSSPSAHPQLAFQGRVVSLEDLPLNNTPETPDSDQIAIPNVEVKTIPTVEVKTIPNADLVAKVQPPHQQGSIQLMQSLESEKFINEDSIPLITGIRRINGLDIGLDGSSYEIISQHGVNVADVGDYTYMGNNGYAGVRGNADGISFSLGGLDGTPALRQPESSVSGSTGTLLPGMNPPNSSGTYPTEPPVTPSNPPTNPPVEPPVTPPLDPVEPVPPNTSPTLVTDALSLKESGVVVGGNTVFPGRGTATGLAAGTDTDGDTLHYSLVDASGALVPQLSTDYGVLIMNPVTGTYSYTLNQDSSTVNILAEGETRQESFTVQVSDGHGGIANSSITVIIEGTNDRPTLELSSSSLIVSGMPSNVLTDSGTASGADVDKGAVLQYGLLDPRTGKSVTQLEDSCGVLRIDQSTGQYTYTLNPKSPDVLKLGANDTLEHTATIIVVDEHGAHSEQPLLITISGGNLPPVINSAPGALQVQEAGVNGNTPEAGTPTASGMLSVSDPNPDTLFSYAVLGADGSPAPMVQGSYGVLTMNPGTGAYSYTLNQASSNSLAMGETRQESFTVQVSDGHGGIATQPLTVQILGTNDKPTLSLSTANLVVRDAPELIISDKGTSSGTDPDNNAGLSYKLVDAHGKLVDSITDSYGTLSIDPATGVYTFVLTPGSTAVDALEDGQSVKLPFTITVSDEHGATDSQPLIVTVFGGTNPPLIRPGSKALTVTEEGLTGSSEPTGDPTDETSFSVTSVVQGQQTVTITLAGKPPVTQVISNNSSCSMTDDYGTLTITATTGSNGTVTYKADYLLDNMHAANNLSDGERLARDYGITVSEKGGGSVKHDLTVTINGSNDAPSIVAGDLLVLKESGVYNGNMPTTAVDGTPGTEQHRLSASGQLSAHDDDTSDVLTYALTTKGMELESGYSCEVKSSTEFIIKVANTSQKVGTLTLAPDGQYTFAIEDNALNTLTADQPLNFTFGASVSDKLGASANTTITVAIRGTNDKPVLTLDTPTLQGIIEGDAQHDSASGTGSSTDADGTHFTYSLATAPPADSPSLLEGPKELHGTYGTLTINPATGVYKYVLDNSDPDTIAMRGGELYQENFYVVVSDAHGAFDTQKLTVEIKGTSVSVTGAEVKESGVYGASSTPDTATSEHAGTTGTPAAGEHKLTATGTLAGNDGSATLTYDYSLEPLNGKDWTVTGVGTDTETAVSPLWGTIALNTTNGSFTFTLDDTAVNALAEGAKEVLSLPVRITSTDGANSLVSIEQVNLVTVYGTNDTPVLDALSKSSLSVVEAGGIDDAVKGTSSDSLTSVGHDADADELHYILVDGSGNPLTASDIAGITFPGGVLSEYGTLKLTGNDTFTFELNNSLPKVQALTAGQNLESAAIHVRAVDEHGALSSETKSFTIKITGADDAPIINPIPSTGEAITESGVASGGNVPFAPGNPDGTFHGKFEFKDKDAGGHSHPHSYTLTDGANAGWTQQTDASGNTTLTSNLGYGTLTLQSDGSYTFALNNGNSTINALAQGATLPLHFKVNARCDGGGFAESTFTLTITGTNDRPTITAYTETLTLYEDQGAGQSVEGRITDVADPDTGDTKSYYLTAMTTATDPKHPTLDETNTMATMAGSYGTLTIDAQGKYSYKIGAAGEKLTTGSTATDIFYVAVKDHNGAFDIQPVTITLTGFDDAPRFTYMAGDSYTASVTEAGVILNGNTPTPGTPSATGTVHAMDPEGDSFSFGFLTNNPDGSSNANGATTDKAFGKYGYITVVTDADGKATYTYTLYTENDATDAPAGALAAINALQHGDTAQDDFYIQASSGSLKQSQALHMTINGTNDRPTITGSTTLATLTEDSGITMATGTVVGTDPDLPAGALRYDLIYNDQPVSTLGSKYGYIELESGTGKYTYHLYNGSQDVQGLTENRPVHDSFTVRVTDSMGAYTEQTMSIDILGDNETPTATVTVPTVTEDMLSTTVLTGQITGSDDEAGTQLTYNSLTAGATAQLEGLYGSLTLSADGSYMYTYTGQAKNQHLQQGTSASDDFTVTVTDQYGAHVDQSVTIKIEGSNDAPLTPTLALNNDYAVSYTDPEAKGLCTSSDVDDGDSWKFYVKGSGENPSFVQTVKGQYGVFTIYADGNYLYTLDREKATSITENVTEAFDVVAVDKLGASSGAQTITFTIPPYTPTGPGEVPAITVETPLTLGIQEDTSTQPTEPQDYQTSSTLKILVDGNPLTPVPSWVTFTLADPKFDDYGVLSINKNTGQCTFVLNNDHPAVQALNEGQTVTKTYKVVVSTTDPTAKPQTVDIDVTVTGKNDVPEVTLTAGAALTENLTTGWNGLISTGTITATDQDMVSADGKTLYDLTCKCANGTDSIEGLYGTLTLLESVDGKWSYTYAATTTAHFNATTHTQDSFVVSVSDGHVAVTQTITIDLNGVNHAPTDLKLGNLEVVEDVADGTQASAKVISVQDDDTQFTYSLIGSGKVTDTLANGTYGTLLLKDDGTYTYRLNHGNATVQALGKDEVLSFNETFTLQVKDPSGATTTQDIHVKITGTNDAPILSLDTPLKVTEAATSTVATGSCAVTDIDAGDTFSYAFTDATGTIIGSVPQPGSPGRYDVLGDIGFFEIDTAGKYSFTLNNNSDIVRAYAEGSQNRVVVHVTVFDNKGGHDTVELIADIKGTNTLPDITVPKTLNIYENDSDKQLTGMIEASDVDRYFNTDGSAASPSQDTLSYKVLDNGHAGQSHTGTYGTLTIDYKTGAYTYKLKDGVDVTGDQQDVFTIMVNDTHGDATADFTFTVKDAARSGRSIGILEHTGDAPDTNLPNPAVPHQADSPAASHLPLFSDLFQDAGELLLAPRLQSPASSTSVASEHEHSPLNTLPSSTVNSVEEVVSLTSPLPVETKLGDPGFDLSTPIDLPATNLERSYLYTPEPQTSLTLDDSSALAVQKAMADQGCL